MKRLFVVLLSLGATAAFGLLAVDVTPALAAKCHCTRGPRGFTGPRGPRGPAGPRGPQGPRGSNGAAGAGGAAGPAGPAGPQGPAGPGLSNWDGVLKTAGQVMTLTVGSFTVTDNDQLGGGGCGDIMVTNNSTSQKMDYAANLNSTSYTPIDPGGSVDIQKAFFNATTPDFLNPFQAVLQDGSSMITLLVGNDNGTAQANGNLPCINVGGVAGT